jgi:hypothetical protein
VRSKQKKADEILHIINELLEVTPEEIPEDSCFLLEINFSELRKSHLKTETYWTLAPMDAVIRAQDLESARGARANIRTRKKDDIDGA